jgi:uncharacterized protein YyaL (SSP411 family)
MREMQAPEGGYYATQDADSEGEEGKFFVWTPDEIEEACGVDRVAAKVLLVTFGVTAEGNFEEGGAPPRSSSGKTVLSVVRDRAEVATELAMSPTEVDEAARRGKARLLEVRERRVKPARDEKVLVSWNGLMIGRMADAGALLDRPDLVASAERAFAFVRRELVRVEGGDPAHVRALRHGLGSEVRGPGFLDDYAFLADAALDLYEVTGKPAYVADARALADGMLRHFAGAEGFYFTPDDGETLLVRTRDAFDQAVPSSTSIALQVLVRLGALVGAPYTESPTSARDLERLAPAALENPFAFGQTLAVLHRLVRGNVEIVLVGARGDARTRALARAALHAYVPNRVLAWADPDDAEARAACAALADGKPARSEPVAYVCRDRACAAPVSDPAQLTRLLERASS